MVENEFKLMLTEEQYTKLYSMYGWDKEYTQTNYYFDTPSLELISSHVTCRVRYVGGEYYLQMKLPNGEDYSRIELEQKLGDALPYKLTAGELKELSGRDDMPDVGLIGELRTLRSIKRFKGAEIDLDKSSYFGKTDYELEIEFTDEATARKLLSELTQAAGIEAASDVCLGKIHRFIAEYKKGEH